MNNEVVRESDDSGGMVDSLNPATRFIIYLAIIVCVCAWTPQAISDFAKDHAAKKAPVVKRVK